MNVDWGAERFWIIDIDIECLIFQSKLRQVLKT